jgi:hypothetical protein
MGSRTITRYLDIYRRKPAITVLDWPFTPRYKSIEPFATGTDSVMLLHTCLYLARISIGSTKHSKLLTGLVLFFQSVSVSYSN